MVTVLFISFVILVLINMPVAFSLAIACLMALMFQSDIPLMIIPQRIFNGLDSFPLLAIPFFILAGGIMDKGGVSRKIINLASAMVGHIRGGLAMITVVASMFFSSMSGSTTAASAAIGKIIIPPMNEKGYSKSFSTALVACSGALGSIIPPSITLIIFGVVGSVSIGKLLLGGVIPGILMGVGLMITSFIIASIKKYPSEPRADFKQIITSFLDAGFALLMPLILIFGILLGIFTATEAAVVAVIYGVFLGVFVYKELKLKDIIDELYNTALISSMVVLLIGVANLFGWLVTSQRLPDLIVEALTSFTTNPYIIYLLIILFLLFVGLFMEATASIIILAPVLLPITTSIGIDPIHFGVVMIVALAIGVVTPPLGVNLFVVSGISGVSVNEILRGIWPFLIAMVLALLVIAFIPTFTLWLPTFMD